MSNILKGDFGEGRNMPEVVENSFWMGLSEAEVVFIFIGGVLFVALMIFTMCWVCDCFIGWLEKRRMREIEAKYEVKKSQVKVRNDRSHVRLSMSPVQMRWMDDLKPQGQDNPYNTTTSPLPQVPLYTFVRK